MSVLRDQLTRLADPRGELEARVRHLRENVRHHRFRGAVVAVSGGVDSSLALAMAARACGPDRVTALALPDRHSAPESAQLAAAAAHVAGVSDFRELSIDAALESLGCFAGLERLLIQTFGEFDAGSHTFRTEFRYAFETSGSLPGFYAVRVGAGDVVERRLRADQHRKLVSLMNLKQRVRAVFTFQVAEELDYAVLCTTNRQEKEQGFFVKNGDGSGDLFPLHDLLKSQIRQLAVAAGLPLAVADRPATTDTYSAEQSQETFFFGWNELAMDVLLAAVDADLADEVIGAEIGASALAVARARALLQRRQGLSGRLLTALEGA